MPELVAENVNRGELWRQSTLTPITRRTNNNNNSTSQHQPAPSTIYCRFFAAGLTLCLFLTAAYQTTALIVKAQGLSIGQETLNVMPDLPTTRSSELHHPNIVESNGQRQNRQDEHDDREMPQPQTRILSKPANGDNPAEKQIDIPDIKPIKIRTGDVAEKPSPSPVKVIHQSLPTPTPSKVEENNNLLLPELNLKCSPWTEDWIDDWWQDHPTWEPSDPYTNDTHTCFQPIADLVRADFYQSLRDNQFRENPETNPACQMDPDNNNNNKNKGLAIVRIQQHGFGKIMVWTGPALFWSAFRENRPFKQIKPSPSFQWHYNPPADSTSWANCPTHDQECYFLPITNCPTPNITSHLVPKDYIGKPKFAKDAGRNQTMEEMTIWMTHYLMRHRQVMRWHLRELMKVAPPLETPCTWIHVRRGDIMSEKGYARNFYSVADYLGKVQKGSNVLLLTDDETAVEEALLLHPEYNWTYWNRTRYRGEVLFNSHFPSDDKALEVLMLFAERNLASRCLKGVHGRSNFVRFLRFGMHLAQGVTFKEIRTQKMDRVLQKGQVTARDFTADLEERLKAARNASSVGL